MSGQLPIWLTAISTLVMAAFVAYQAHLTRQLSNEYLASNIQSRQLEICVEAIAVAREIDILSFEIAKSNNIEQYPKDLNCRGATQADPVLVVGYERLTRSLIVSDLILPEKSDLLGLRGAWDVRQASVANACLAKDSGEIFVLSEADKIAIGEAWASLLGKLYDIDQRCREIFKRL